MTLETRCPRCGGIITASDEDDLVRQVQDHARDHGGAHGRHVPTREHVLGHLHDPRRHTPDK